ncbi:ATP-dependent helicase [Pedobacter aquatilis]|uniref:ATP-dependent helicase n=1 Tax=Pedobacter aquatilis TaxID=351343 RepID=UPI002930AA9A|nr:ATP-dependent helicase [Pedobacter aquatilis]
MFEGLNDEQRKAVIAQSHVLLTACPGSGKTRVLTYRVAYELERLRHKKIVAALTFTNRASDEIKRRVDRLDMDSGRLWAGTIHAFCLEWILYPYCGYLEELRDGFVIADEFMMEDLIGEVKIEFGYKRNQRLSTRINPDGSLFESDASLHEVITEYRERLAAAKMIDFDQMLFLSYKLLCKLPKLCATLNAVFQLICVDEYQDTKELQYCILSKIVNIDPSRTTIFFVGDADQAIYGSLGGVAKSITEIKAVFNGLDIQELKLSGNYRSTQRSIDYYRNFQSANIDIESRCEYRDAEGVISFENTVLRDELADRIAEIIQVNIDNGVPEREICVLGPQWWMIITMGRKLKGLLPNVEFDAVGLSPLTRNRENIWFKFARLFLVDPAPNMYFVRSRWAGELLAELDLIGLHLLFDVEQRTKRLLRTLNSISSAQNQGLDYLEDCFSQFMACFGINLEYYPLLKLHWISFFESTRKKLSERDFQYASDVKGFKRMFKHNQGVVVNTCHGIKGEEFHTVICFGLLDGYIPNASELNRHSAANKLLYVICSRAKRHLHLFSEQGHWYNRDTTPQLEAVAFDYDKRDW